MNDRCNIATGGHTRHHPIHFLLPPAISNSQSGSESRPSRRAHVAPLARTRAFRRTQHVVAVAVPVIDVAGLSGTDRRVRLQISRRTRFESLSSFRRGRSMRMRRRRISIRHCARAACASSCMRGRRIRSRQLRGRVRQWHIARARAYIARGAQMRRYSRHSRDRRAYTGRWYSRSGARDCAHVACYARFFGG